VRNGKNEGVRIAYTLEQCWRRVPGGTGTSALEVLKELLTIDECDVVGVAGRHRHRPTPGFEPPISVASFPIGGALLVEAWTRAGWPLVESLVDGLDVVHSTTIIAPATHKPLVTTIHDVAFLHHPEFFTARGNKVFRRSLNVNREKATVILCSSAATMDDCLNEGFTSSRLRHVPLGVRAHDVSHTDRQRVQQKYGLPNEFVLFVGTVEPRKNLSRLVAALESLPGAPPLVIAGIEGWGDAQLVTSHEVHPIGYVAAQDLPALYSLCAVFAFPSILEGYGLPVVEAMAHGAPVVTSRGTSTEEVAGGAGVLVDPLDVASIASGIRSALDRRDDLIAQGYERARQLPWSATAALTVEAYKDAMEMRS
jgi:glycosyltransferase involved in cell wall biosynthesis